MLVKNIKIFKLNFHIYIYIIIINEILLYGKKKIYNRYFRIMNHNNSYKIIWIRYIKKNSSVNIKIKLEWIFIDSGLLFIKTNVYKYKYKYIYLIFLFNIKKKSLTSNFKS